MRRLLLLCSVLTNLLLSLWIFLIFRVSSDDTIYAPQFSQAKFSEVDCTMHASDVERLLGRPLYKQSFDKSGNLLERVVNDTRVIFPVVPRNGTEASDREDWGYSAAGPKSDNYNVRIVRFDNDLKVRQWTSEFYAD